MDLESASEPMFGLGISTIRLFADAGIQGRCAVLTPVFMQACTFMYSMNACTDYNHTTIYSVVAVRAQVR